MAANVLIASLLTLLDKPHHLKNFGSLECSEQSQWFTTWPFLHYDEPEDIVFCHTCVKAFNVDRIKSSNNTANVFVSAKDK